MSGPHSRVVMIPFGCVIEMKVTRSGESVSIHTDLKSIAKKHAGLQPVVTALRHENGVPSYQATPGLPAVISRETVAVQFSWHAFKLSKSTPNALPQKLSQIELMSPMVPGYLYFLAPAATQRRARKGAASKKGAKKKSAANKR